MTVRIASATRQSEWRNRSQHEADSWAKRRVRQHEGAIADPDRVGQVLRRVQSAVAGRPSRIAESPRGRAPVAGSSEA